MPQWDIASHTLNFTQDANGIVHTYSWGNTGNSHGWNYDRPEDIVGAFDALHKGYAKKVGDSSLDPYIQEAFNLFNNTLSVVT